MINFKVATRKCLKKHGMKQKDLAQKLGVKEGQISIWVNSSNLNTSVIEKLAKPFDLRVSEFIKLGERDGY